MSRRAGWSVVIGLVFAARAWGGTPVLLPAGESPAVWARALDGADLEVAVAADAAAVRIEAAGAFWRLAAVKDGVVVRTLTVAAPTTDTERAEVAVLARSLCRPLAPLERPASALPPPPPPVARHVPPPAPAPAPVEAAPVEPPAEAPLARTRPVRVAPVPREPAVFPDPLPDPLPDPIAVAAAPPPPARVSRPRRPRRTALAPVSFAVGVAGRPELQAAATAALRVDAVSWRRMFLATEVGFSPMRNLRGTVDPSAWWHGYWEIPAGAVVGVAPSRGVRLGAVGGAAFRGFRQQGLAIDEALVPFVGGEGELTLGGGVRTGVRARITTDLRPVVVVNAQGAATTLVPWEAGASVVLRIGPFGDPNPAVATLPM